MDGKSNASSKNVDPTIIAKPFLSIKCTSYTNPPIGTDGWYQWTISSIEIEQLYENMYYQRVVPNSRHNPNMSYSRMRHTIDKTDLTYILLDLFNVDSLDKIKDGKYTIQWYGADSKWFLYLMYSPEVYGEFSITKLGKEVSISIDVIDNVVSSQDFTCIFIKDIQYQK